MECFNHKNVSAVGTCKSCNKALCHDCLTDLKEGIACKNRHEDSVKDMQMIIDKSAEIYKKAPSNNALMPAFYIFMGIIFAYFGYTSEYKVNYFALILGVGFIFFGVVIYFKNRALFKNKDN